MEISQMKNRVILAVGSIVTNENGFSSIKYQDIKEVWAKVETVSSELKEASDKQSILDTKQFIIRTTNEIDFKQKYIGVKYKGIYYNMKSFDDTIQNSDFIGIVAEVYDNGS